MPEIILFDKQADFFKATNRINCYIGGIQSGKTTGGALRMTRALSLFKDSLDTFIIAADTYKTLSQATLPKFEYLAKGLVKINRQSGEFKTVWGAKGFLRTATDPESVEGITNVRHIWLDEGGKVSRYFFENLMGRAAFKEAPIDITTTPYAMNWLAQLIKDSRTGKRLDVTAINCRSIDSPYFPKTEYERQKTLLDPRRFAMKYEGEFGKMEGLVYDLYDQCLIKSFPLPTGTIYYGGVDWGYSPDPFCLTVRGVTPEGKHYRIFEFYKNFLTISDVVDILTRFHAIYQFKMLFCDPSQPAHIDALSRARLPAMGANNDIRYGIDKHYALMKAEKFYIFEDQCQTGIDEYSTYCYREPKELKLGEDSREKDQMPVGQNDHGCDADRYTTLGLEFRVGERFVPSPPDLMERPRDLQKRIEWLKRGGTSRYNK